MLSVTLDMLMTPNDRRFLYRTLILGAAVTVMSVVSGIVMRFWYDYGSDLFQVSGPEARQLILQATAGPIFFGLVLFFITLPLFILAGVLLFFAFRKSSLVLSSLGFSILGGYWLFLVLVVSGFAED